MNEFKSLINKYMKLNELKRSKLALRLGYKNITSGLRKLDTFIEQPTSDEPFKLKLQQSLQIPNDEFELAIAQRLEHIELECRRHFKPFIQTIVSSRPSPIFVAGLVPKLWNIAIDEELQMSDYKNEIAIVICKYQELQLKHAEGLSVASYADLVIFLNDCDQINKPYSWMFGRGFRYFRKFDETLIFDRDCILQKTSTTAQPSIAYVSI